ncbi:MAG: holo-ACP synthase [Proteobacteria bacterium]|nr:holo-ACP synthase [Pseudomonadota bacterium]
MVHGVGIEIVSVERFLAVMDRRGEKFLRRLFTEAELRYCKRKKSPAVHLSARFAAKRSLFKALGRSLGYASVEVVHDGNGAPSLAVEGPGIDGLRCSLSISHSADYSIAETIVEKI